MLKLLVVGSTGYVGKAFSSDVEEATSLWHLARSKTRKGCFSVRSPTGLSKDVSHFGDLVQTLKPVGLDAIINLAGDTSKGNSFVEIGRLVEANVELTANLLELCHSLDGVKFLTASTFSIFADDGSLRPQTFYAATKKMADDTCAFFVESGQVASATSLELFDIYGPAHHPHKVIPQMVQSLRNSELLTIHDDGSRIIRPVFVDDVVTAIQCALSELLGREGSFLQFSVPGGEEIAVRELFAVVAAEMGLDDWEGLLKTGHTGQVPPIRRAIPHFSLLPNWSAKVGIREGVGKIISDALAEEGNS